MKFAYPEFLYAFLVLLIPIIIHLFNFRRYKTLYFSSLQFLKKLDEQTKSVKQIKNWLVLILRLLAFSFLVLAFAQPYLPGKENRSSAGQGALAVYLDNSFSMSAMATNGSLLNQGKEVVREVVEKSQPGTNLLLVTDDLKGKESRLVRKADFLDRLDRIDYTANSKPLKSPLKFMSDALDDQFIEGDRQYIIVSDFQKMDEDFDNLKIDTSGIYYPFKVIPQSYDNLYIDSVWFSMPLRKINQPNELNVRIANTSSSDLANVSLNLEVGDVTRDILVDLPKDAKEVVTVNYTDQSYGLKHGKVEISDDQLFFDDAFHFSYKLVEEINILLINGEKANEYPQKVFSTDKMFNLQSVDIKQLKLSELTKNDLVVLNELKEIPSALISKVKEFTEGGGKLLIIPHEEINLTTYNQLISSYKLPLFAKKEENERRLSNLDFNHSFFRGMFRKKSTNINLPKIKNLYKPTVRTESSFNSLISFEDNTPFFVSSSSDQECFVFYAGTDENFGDLKNHSIFVALLLRIGALSQSKNELFATLGEQLAYKLPIKIENPSDIKLTSDDGFEFIPQIQNRGGSSVILMEQDLVENIKAGNHFVNYKGEKIDVLSLNYGRGESVFQTYDENEILDQFKSLGAKNIQMSSFEDLKDVAQLRLDKPTEYWRILLILTLICLLVEILILKFWKL